MTSMRKLKRRLLRWQRYAVHYRPGHRPTLNAVHPIRDPRGFIRADVAVFREQQRRKVRAIYWPLDRHLDDWGIR